MGHGQTDVDGGSDTLVEQLGFQEDLSVSDGDDVGGDVGRHVSGLGLDDGKRGEGAAAHGVAHLGGSLQQPGVEVEHISGVSLTAGGAPQQQGHLSVGHGLLGQVVEDDDGVHAVVSEVLSHGHARVGGQVLQGSGVRGSGGHNDGVLHGISIGQSLDNLGHGRSLLADGNVDAEQLLLGVSSIVESLLVDDGVNGDGGFAGLPVANDQLTLATALMPVCMGSLTDCLGMMPGAFSPTLYLSLHPIGPLPSMGLPRASTTRPRISLPTGTSTMAPVLLTTSPSLMSLSLPNTTTPTLSGSKLRAMPFSPELNSTISSAWMFLRP